MLLGDQLLGEGFLYKLNIDNGQSQLVVFRAIGVPA
jgi:hypothetical protein